MKNILGNLLLLGLSLAVIIAVGEAASRYVSPISPGPRILDSKGNTQKISYIKPHETFRIITPDFDAVTTITKDGYRGPEAGGGENGPETIFIGDSFTYAQGVEDHQTFSAIYCKAKKESCANLGVPGASTLYEVDRLENYLEKKNWRPHMVHFFFFTGNDFSDNLAANSQRKKGLPYEPVELNPSVHESEKGTTETIIDAGLRHSNLLRVAYYKVLPMIRNNDDKSSDSLGNALEITKAEFTRLDKLSKKYGFNYNLYVIFSEPEITLDKYQDIGIKLQSQSSKSLVQLGDLFKDNPSKYFFPSDGHFNIAGNKKLAEFLLSKNDEGSPKQVD